MSLSNWEDYTYVLPMDTVNKPYSTDKLWNLRPFLKEPADVLLVDKLIEYDIPLDIMVSRSKGGMFLCINVFSYDAISRVKGLAPYTSFLRKGPLWLSVILFAGGRASGIPHLPSTADISFAVDRALCCKDIFVIYTKADTKDIYTEIARRLLGTEPHEESFEAYKERIESQIPNLRFLPYKGLIKNIKKKLMRHAVTYSDLIANLQEAYFTALPMVERDVLAAFNSTITAFCPGNKDTDPVSAEHKELAVSILDRFIDALPLTAEESVKNVTLREYLSEINREEMQKYLNPLDSTRPLVHMGTVVADTNICGDEAVILNAVKNAKRLILLGNGDSNLFKLFLKAAAGKGVIYDTG